MILKKLYLYLNREEFKDELGIQFGFKTRYLCNFIERKISPIKFKTDSYSKICIMGTLEKELECLIVPENSLLVPVYFDKDKYQNIDQVDLHEYFIEFLSIGLNNASNNFLLPHNEILDSISDFRNQSYINEWVHASKKSKDKKYTATLICTLSQNTFNLKLILECTNTVVMNKIILETKPDETIYGHRFKNLMFNENELIIADKFGKTIHRENLNCL